MKFYLNKLLFANSFWLLLILFRNCQLAKGELEELEEHSDDESLKDREYLLDFLSDGDVDYERDHVVSYTTNLTMVSEFMGHLQFILERQSNNILLTKQLFHMNLRSLSDDDELLLEKNSSSQQSTVLQMNSIVKYQLLLLDMVSLLNSEMSELGSPHEPFTLRLTYQSNMLLVTSNQMIELFVLKTIFCADLSISAHYTVHKVKNEFLDETQPMDTLVISRELIPIKTFMNYSDGFVGPLCSLDLVQIWLEGNETNLYFQLKYLVESFIIELDIENSRNFSRNISQLIEIDNEYIHLSMTQLPLSICYVTSIGETSTSLQLLPNCIKVLTYYEAKNRYLYNVFLIFLIYLLPFLLIMLGYHIIAVFREKYSHETDLSSYPKIKRMTVDKFINKLDTTSHKSKKSDMKMEALLHAIQMNIVNNQTKNTNQLDIYNKKMEESQLIENKTVNVQPSRNGYENQSFRSCVSSLQEILEETTEDCEGIKNSEDKFNDVMDFIQMARVKYTINKCFVIPKK